VLVTGAGRAFSAGGDMKAYIDLQRDPVEFPRFVAELHRVFGRLRTLPVPVVALVNGVTAAGGLELVLNCDFAIVAASARLGDAHLNFGQMGGGGVLTLLPRAIGRAKAAELIFSGRLLSADEAVEWGLASRCVPDGELLTAGLDFAREVAAKSPLAVANAKWVMNQLWADNGSVDAGLRYELERDAYYCLTSADAPEGLAAFAERRPPRFEGR
jgi:enoyl-CoA hydratase/carnithine racemase